MFYPFHELTAIDSIFWLCALLGTGLFLVQFVLSLFVGDGDADVDDGGAEVDAGKFKWLSKQAVTGFIMMFGWVGLTARREFGCAEISSSLFGSAGGLFAMFVTALIFRGAKKLHSSGTLFNIEDAIGKEATVYQRIPKGGQGKVTLSLHNLTHEIDAVSEHPEELDSFTQVQIIKKVDAATVVVAPIK